MCHPHPNPNIFLEAVGLFRSSLLLFPPAPHFLVFTSALMFFFCSSPSFQRDVVVFRLGPKVSLRLFYFLSPSSLWSIFFYSRHSPFLFLFLAAMGFPNGVAQRSFSLPPLTFCSLELFPFHSYCSSVGLPSLSLPNHKKTCVRFVSDGPYGLFPPPSRTSPV